MGVCAMFICVQRGIVVTFNLSFPDLHEMEKGGYDIRCAIFRFLLGFVLTARRHELHLIIPEEVIYSDLTSRLFLRGRRCS